MTAIVGTSSSTATGSVMPRMLNSMAGTKFKIIRGYDPAEVFLAMERGELDGLCGYGWGSMKTARPDFIRDKKLNLILQFSNQSHAELEGKVPVMMDYITNPRDRSMLNLVFGTQEMGRPFVGPPAMPKARVAALRNAFNMVMKDPAFLADAKKTRITINYHSGAEVDKLIAGFLATPADAIAMAKKALARPKKK